VLTFRSFLRWGRHVALQGHFIKCTELLQNYKFAQFDLHFLKIDNNFAMNILKEERIIGEEKNTSVLFKILKMFGISFLGNLKCVTL